MAGSTTLQDLYKDLDVFLKHISKNPSGGSSEKRSRRTDFQSVLVRWGMTWDHFSMDTAHGSLLAGDSLLLHKNVIHSTKTTPTHTLLLYSPLETRSSTVTLWLCLSHLYCFWNSLRWEGHVFNYIMLFAWLQSFASCLLPCTILKPGRAMFNASVLSSTIAIANRYSVLTLWDRIHHVPCAHYLIWLSQQYYKESTYSSPPFCMCGNEGTKRSSSLIKWSNPSGLITQCTR